MNKQTVIELLKQHQEELKALGIEHLSLFGSIARSEEGPDSDIDLAAKFDRNANIGMLEFVAVHEKLKDLLDHPVDLVSEPARKPRIQLEIDRDRVDAF